MKHLVAIFFVLFSLGSFAQNLETYKYGKNTLTGKVILKSLRHPVSGKIIENAMVFLLSQPVMFIPANKEEDTATTREIRIYGDVTRNVDPNLKYKNLINKNVSITADYEFAPSGNYPLLVNIIKDFSYKIIQ